MVRETTDKKQFSLMLCIAFCIYMATQMIGTTIATYADSMGASAQYIGIITGSFGLMALLPRPVAGQIVDKEDNRLLMFVVLLFCVVSSGILLFAKAPFLLLVSRAVYGLGWGLGSTLCLTNACNTLSEKDMMKGISVYTLAQTLAMVLGPSAALFIRRLGGYFTLYLVCTALMLAALAFACVFRPANRGNKELRYSVNLREMFAPEVLAPAVLSACSSVIYSATVAFVLLYAADRGVEDINWFFTLEALMILAFRPLVSRFVTEKNLVKVTVGSNVLYAVYLVVVTLAYSKAMFAAAAVLMGISMAASQPAIFNLCVAAVGPERRGRATNTNYAATDVGSFLGPWLTGLLVGSLGYRGIFLMMLVPLGVGLGVFVLHYRGKKQDVKV